jgi:hypothetical protein
VLLSRGCRLGFYIVKKSKSLASRIIANKAGQTVDVSACTATPFTVDN